MDAPLNAEETVQIFGSGNTLGSFARFSQVAESVAATSKRLEKSSILADYFETLDDDDLSLAARYLSGRVFPLRDQRTTNIGSSALRAAIQEVTRVELDRINERLVAHGDFGDLAYEVWGESSFTRDNTGGIALVEVSSRFNQLAGTSGSHLKLSVVIGLLRTASSLEAKYLVKLLTGDIRIGLQEGAVEDAISRWRGEPIGLIQWVNMLTGDIGETAILALRGRLGEAKMRLFHPLKFMLATSAADLADVARQMPPEFVVEDKFDGIRAQAHIGLHVPGDDVLHGVEFKGRRVALFSRTLDEVTKSFPDLVPSLAQLVPADGDADTTGLILDGEILPVRGSQILPFQDLQQRLGRKVPTAEIIEQVPLAFIVYDALFCDGEILLEEPFQMRRGVIEKLRVEELGGVRPAESRRFTDVQLLDDEFVAARARGNEGLMVKNPDSFYKPGKRGRDWLKIKRALATLDVVVTSVEVGNGRRNKVLSDYAFAVRASETDPTLLNVGKAYSGLTDAEIAELSEWFTAHTIQSFAHGKVRTVEPKIVIEVTFDRVQPSNRHKSGFALRFPRIVRIRPDKPASEIDTLETVRKLVDPESREDVKPEE